MPIFAYFSVIGSLLLGLLYFAEARLGPPTSLSVSTQFHGLPQPWKANDSVQILTVRDAPAPNLPETAFAKAELQPKLEPAKHVKQAGGPKKKKIARVPPSGPRSRYAHSIFGLQRGHGTVW